MAAAPSWADLAERLRAASTSEERTRREDQAAGYGPANYFAAKRLFDAPPDTQPRITFYHDSNVWCPFCETMWLYLEEKRIPYTAYKINKEQYGARDDWYWNMGARGVPSVRIDDGKLISGANFHAVEQVFPDTNPMIPGDDDPAAGRWDEMDRTMHEFGDAFWALNKAELPGHRGAVTESAQYRAFLEAADRLNAALGAHGGPYLTGPNITILDCEFTRNAERAAAMLPYFKGVQVRRNPRWPHLERWYVSMEARPTYKRITGDFYTHVSATPLQVPFLVGSKHVDGSRYAAEIDGTDPSAWTLPLPEDDGTLLEPLSSLGLSADEARREAAEAILHNHRAVVGFAARGMVDKHAQQPGSRDPAYAAKYGAALPPTQSGAEIGKDNLGPKYGGSEALSTPPEVATDVALRYTVLVLLDGPSEAAMAAIATEGLRPKATRACLGYLRDRISVPRDMTYPAARQLRAHLNYVIRAVEGASTKE